MELDIKQYKKKEVLEATMMQEKLKNINLKEKKENDRELLQIKAT